MYVYMYKGMDMDMYGFLLFICDCICIIRGFVFEIYAWFVRSLESLVVSVRF